MLTIPRRAVLALPLLAARTAAAATPMAARPLSRAIGWWQKRHQEKLAELREKNPALIFLGDSITQDWEVEAQEPWRDFAAGWRRFYGDRNAVNLGFKGDATCHLLWRIENGEVSGYTPKVAVVLIGANNLGRLHWTAGDTIFGIDTIINELRHRQPTTKILLLGVLPSYWSYWLTKTTVAIDKGLAARYRDGGVVTYMDVGHLFIKDGRTNPDLYADPRFKPPEPPLHPTAEAQNMISAAIEPTLARLLGDRVHQ